MIRNAWNSSIEYLAKNDVTTSKGFKKIHIITMALTYVLAMSLIGTSILSAPMYNGNKNLELIMTSIQSIEPILTITAFILIIKGKRSFYWHAISGQAIILVTQSIQGMYMGVIRAFIMIVVFTITYIKWSDQPTELFVKKADKKIWAYITISLISIFVAPALLIQFFAQGTIFEPPSVWMGWMDAAIFSLVITSLALNVNKYREARLMQFLSAFLWPVILFSSQIWIFAVNSLFMWLVATTGMAKWYYLVKNPQAQLK